MTGKEKNGGGHESFIGFGIHSGKCAKRLIKLALVDKEKLEKIPHVNATALQNTYNKWVFSCNMTVLNFGQIKSGQPDFG